MKKLWTIIASVFMIVVCLCLMDTSAQAAEIVEYGECGDELTWELDSEGTLTITGSGAMTDYSATACPPWFNQRDSIVRVHISDGVTTIGNLTFSSFTALTEVTIGSDVKRIGTEAFSCCDKLTSVTIPEGVTRIGVRAFEHCNSLASVTIPEGVTRIGSFTFSGCSGLTSVTIPGSIVSIGDYAFNKCSGLTSVTIPEGVTRIELAAFSGCSGLTSITIPETVTSIEGGTFHGCSRLTSITIPENVTSIEEGTFYGCSSLTSITIPQTVTSIGVRAFCECSRLTSVTIPGSVVSIGDGAFSYCSGLTGVTIMEGVASIGASAFCCCSNLTSVTIPQGVTSIGKGAFQRCDSLTSVTIPEGVVSIGDFAFDCCTSLTSVTIPGSVVSIGDFAFRICTSLTSVTIPQSVTSIGKDAYSYCSSLQKLAFLGTAPSIDSNCFYNVTTMATYPCGDTSWTVENRDNYGGTITWEADHSYEAVTTSPTCTQDGYTICTCASCGDSYTENLVPATGHSFLDGICTSCGELVIVPELTMSYPALSFEDEIFYNVYYTVDDVSSIAEMGLITFNERLTEGTIEDAVDVISGYSSNGSNYMVHTNGIPAKALGDTVYFKVYAKLSDGSYVYSGVAGYHAVAYANSVLNSDSYADDVKAMMVAMLNYGAAAQEYFGYKTDSLINAGLTAEQLALVTAYDESMVDDVVEADSAKTGAFVMNGGYSNIYPTVSFEGAFSINYYFTPDNTPDDGLTFYYWDAGTYNSVDLLTAENATGTVDMVLDGSDWFAAVDGIAAKEIDKTIYVAASYTSGGVTYNTNVFAYSLGNYCESVAEQGNVFCAATAVYGYYAKSYFG